MFADVYSSVVRLLHTHDDHFHGQDTVGMDASIAAQARILINALKTKYDKIFGSAAQPVSAAMADNVNRNSYASVGRSIEPLNIDASRNWKISLKSLDKRTLNVLRAATASSASFITSIPERYINNVASELFGSIATGNGLADLVPYLEKQAVTITNWAHNTALDQTRKAYNGLNAGRMKQAGITHGEWIHSGGSQHPRELHEDFDGKTFDLSVGAPVGDDGGDDVMPGEEPNCRCTFGPVITSDDPEETPEDVDDAE